MSGHVLGKSKLTSVESESMIDNFLAQFQLCSLAYKLDATVICLLCLKHDVATLSSRGGDLCARLVRLGRLQIL